MKGKLSKGSFGSFVVECEVCHNKNSIYPPSRDYVKIIPRPCERQDSMERPYNCQKCEKPYKVHWDLDHSIPFERDPAD